MEASLSEKTSDASGSARRPSDSQCAGQFRYSVDICSHHFRLIRFCIITMCTLCFVCVSFSFLCVCGSHSDLISCQLRAKQERKEEVPGRSSMLACLAKVPLVVGCVHLFCEVVLDVGGMNVCACVFLFSSFQQLLLVCSSPCLA